MFALLNSSERRDDSRVVQYMLPRELSWYLNGQVPEQGKCKVPVSANGKLRIFALYRFFITITIGVKLTLVMPGVK